MNPHIWKMIIFETDTFEIKVGRFLGTKRLKWAVYLFYTMQNLSEYKISIRLKLFFFFGNFLKFDNVDVAFFQFISSELNKIDKCFEMKIFVY